MHHPLLLAEQAISPNKVFGIMKLLVARVSSVCPEETLTIIGQNLWKFLLRKMRKIPFPQLKPCLVLLDFCFPMQFYSTLTLFSLVTSLSL